MNPPLPNEVVTMMAKREHRMHHWLWHEVRNNWNDYPKDVQSALDDLGWKPPRPAFIAPNIPDVTNNSGEDFLFMHRQMIADVNQVLAQVGDPNYPRVQGWLVPPPPDDPDFPVPPAWFNPSTQAALPFGLLSAVKTDIFYRKRMLYWHRVFTNPNFLRAVTLGVLGTLIEQTIHNAMHLRWASNPAGTRPDPSPVEPEKIDVKWDDPRYNWLGDTYSSHVHPIFWRLHGWIDDRVEDWKLANGVFGDEFWTGTWVGPEPGHEHPEAPAAGGVHQQMEDHRVAAPHAAAVEQAAAVVTNSGVLFRPFVSAVLLEAA